jgi:hypothetical protein
MKDTEARLQELEKKIFFLWMKDRWSAEDYRTEAAWKEELKNLKKGVDK